MSSDNNHHEMFSAEAFEAQEELNRLFTVLEKKPKDKKTFEAIFRIVHTLKGNSMALGFEGIGELGHALEELLGNMKTATEGVDKDLFDLLYRANDKLSELIDAIKTGERVNYKGLVAKLEIYNENYLSNTPDNDSDTTEINPIIQEEELSEPEDMPEDETKISFSDQIQIPVKKLDQLLNLVGELIIEKDTLITNQEKSHNSKSVFKRLNRISSDIQYAVMDARLVQIDELFKKFHRIARDVADAEKKEVNLSLDGTQIEIDRNILKSISNSLIHLVRNAISHGIESPEKRLAAGKSRVGNVLLAARNDKDAVLITVSDDGKGLDPYEILNKAIEKEIISKDYGQSLSESEMIQLIFESGFSNAQVVTDISGRGVGMDAVKKSVEAIGGQVIIESEIGKGSNFTLRLPTSMAVKGTLLFEQKSQEYALPLTSTEAVISIRPNEIFKVGNALMTTYLAQTILLVFLEDVFNMEDFSKIRQGKQLHQSFDKLENFNGKLNVIIINHNNRYVGLVVDKPLQQKEIVEKPLHKPLDQITLFSGATILGNGNVCMVLNISVIMDELYQDRNKLRKSLLSES